MLRTQSVIAALRQEVSLPAARHGARAARVLPPALSIPAVPRPEPAPMPVSAAAPGPALATKRAPAIVAATARLLPVFGAPLAGGLIAATATDAQIEAPPRAGPRAFGLRVCRATLGAGLPASATVVVDPDCTPMAGGLAAIRSPEGFRLVSVTFDRMGATKGYSIAPDIEIAIDDLDSADVAAVIAAYFV